jgi:hypothetical protein
MLWGQSIRVFTDHPDLMRDALGLTLDRVCQWRLLLEEYGPKIVYIKGIHNMLQMQSHGLSMTPVSIRQLRVTI